MGSAALTTIGEIGNYLRNLYNNPSGYSFELCIINNL